MPYETDDLDDRSGLVKLIGQTIETEDGKWLGKVCASFLPHQKAPTSQNHSD